MAATWMELRESRGGTSRVTPLRRPKAVGNRARNAEDLVAAALAGAAVGCFVGFLLGWRIQLVHADV